MSESRNCLEKHKKHSVSGLKKYQKSLWGGPAACFQLCDILFENNVAVKASAQLSCHIFVLVPLHWCMNPILIHGFIGSVDYLWLNRWRGGHCCLKPKVRMTLLCGFVSVGFRWKNLIIYLKYSDFISCLQSLDADI